MIMTPTDVPCETCIQSKFAVEAVKMALNIADGIEFRIDMSDEAFESFKQCNRDQFIESLRYFADGIKKDLNRTIRMRVQGLALGCLESMLPDLEQSGDDNTKKDPTHG